MQRMINPWNIGLLALLGYFAIRDGAMNDPMTWLMNIVIMLPAIVIGLSFHEFAHALVLTNWGMTPQNFKAGSPSIRWRISTRLDF